MDKGLHPPFLQEENYRRITLTSLADKIYNALLPIGIEPEIEKILWKNQNGCRRNRFTTSYIFDNQSNFRWCPRKKNLEATILFVDFSKVFDSVYREKMEQILLSHGLSKETVAAILMLYKITKGGDFRRCPWWNGYRRRKWTRRLEFKSWTRMIAFHIALIPLGKVWIQ